MTLTRRKDQMYEGFEQGPIRPPSESASLLIRITRNCPWNRCSFCPVYKGDSFSLRPVDHVLKDIDLLHNNVTKLQELADKHGALSHTDISPLSASMSPQERMALSGSINWMRGGMKSVFLQDANSLIIKPRDLVKILSHLMAKFPWIERITSYARSHTIARISDDDLANIANAGLNRIHIGMESGSDEVLKRIKKGVDKATQIKAGRKVKKAGMELSEYVMPGLGGVDLSKEHATETADALNRINPDFIRLRTLAIPNHVELHDQWRQGHFSKLSERMVVEEIHLFLDNLSGITSTLASDHVLNLFEEIKGRFPEDKEKMLSVVSTFLELPAGEQVIYQVGRRMGLLTCLDDLSSPAARSKVQHYCAKFQITPENVDEAVDELMKRFI